MKSLANLLTGIETVMNPPLPNVQENQVNWNNIFWSVSFVNFGFWLALNRERYWNYNSYVPENNNPPGNYPPPGHYTPGHHPSILARFSMSPTLDCHNPRVMDYVPRPSSSLIAQPNERDRLQVSRWEINWLLKTI
jgi:hypothetical protein